ncbi:MAG: DEAD/DEAH box helicase family protein, partial [Acholeplasmataceae bacterium]
EHFKNKGSLVKVENRKLDPAYDVYMALYQQLTGDENLEAFRQFQPEFFDLIVVDECHRGSADENSQWRRILDYFKGAIHIGMTATPKETEDISNRHYFGDSIYTYSLKQGIDDGFLAPYKVLRIGIDKDLEGYIPEQGKIDIYGQEVEQRVYTSKDFDRKIIIDQRTMEVARKITDYLKSTDRYSKTIVFCVDQEHADRMRMALVNENADMCAIDSRYVMRITSDDKVGKEQLDHFADNGSKYPTIVTTSELLSTGVDIQMCKVIVLDQMINSMTKFKQIIGRGTRLVWDRDKRYFSILDFRKATLLFSDPEFDGTATSVYIGDGDDDVLPEEPPTEGDPGEEEDNGKKYRVNDVTAKIISEIELIYGPDGKLIINHSENLKQLIAAVYPTFEDFKKDWMSSDKKTIINNLEEQGVDFSRLKEKIGEDVDLYDIIAMSAYGIDATLKSERISHVMDSEFYIQLKPHVKEVVDDLFAVYQKLDVFEIENIQVFKLKRFEKNGGFIPTVKKIGGKQKYNDLIKTIVHILYEE